MQRDPRSRAAEDLCGDTLLQLGQGGHFERRDRPSVQGLRSPCEALPACKQMKGIADERSVGLIEIFADGLPMNASSTLSWIVAIDVREQRVVQVTRKNSKRYAGRWRGASASGAMASAPCARTLLDEDPVGWVEDASFSMSWPDAGGAPAHCRAGPSRAMS